MRISDWSSDVCSSDLDADRAVAGAGAARHHGDAGAAGHLAVGFGHVGDAAFLPAVDDPDRVLRVVQGSEERRVGKECVSTCRSRWVPYYYKKNIHISIYNKSN